MLINVIIQINVIINYSELMYGPNRRGGRPGPRAASERLKKRGLFYLLYLYNTCPILISLHCLIYLYYITLKQKVPRGRLALLSLAPAPLDRPAAGAASIGKLRI